MSLKNQEELKFTTIKELENTPIKNQAHSSTCWSFSTISFIESELLRMGNKQMNLSEMFVVRKTYPRKAKHYVRMHGMIGFGATSLAGDTLRVVRDHGLVPEGIYDGKLVGESPHNHMEMDAVLKGVLDAIISKKGVHLSKVWPDTIESILDIYLGEMPESFEFDGKTYTPRTFADQLMINPDDYIEISSYTHHPFYENFFLEVPDNWGYNQYFNLPLNDFMEVIDHAIENGFSLVWDGDITENSFKQALGIALLPLKEWDQRTKEERANICKVPEPEKEVTQELRQESFDNYKTTDDHLMHIAGLAKDQNGTKFYKAKNSWGIQSSKYGGYVYMSESYTRSKTVSVMLHKDGLPPNIAEHLEKNSK